MARRMLARIGGIALGLAVALGAAPSHAVTAASVIPQDQKSYARLIVKAATLPRHEVRLSGTILVITFAEPLKTDLGRLSTLLPGYLSAARLDPDGRALRFALTRGFRVNTITAGDELYIDLITDKWKGPPPSLPKEVIEALSRRAQAAEAKAREAEQRLSSEKPATLAFSVVRQPALTRLSFAWSKPITPSLAREGDTVVLSFDRTAPLSLTALTAELPPEIRSATSLDVDGRLTLRLGVTAAAEVRGFWDETVYLVDVLGKPDAGRLRLVEGSAQGGVTSESRPASPESASIPAQAQAPAIQVAAQAPSNAPPAAPTPAQPLPAGPAVPDRQEGGPAPLPPLAARAPMPAMAEAPAPVPAAEPASEAPAAASETAPGQRPAARNPERERRANGARLSFAIPTSVPAAVFQRDERIWLVFDTPEPIDLPLVMRENADVLQDAALERVGAAQVVRARLARPALVTAGGVDGRWTVDLAANAAALPRSLTLARDFGEGARALAVIGLERIGQIHRLRDSVAGDDLLVATASGDPQGVSKRQDFVDFSLLPSAQGVALVPRADDLESRSEARGLVLALPSGLNVTPGAMRASVLPSRSPDAERPAFINFSGWAAPPERGVTGAVRDLVRASAAIEQEAKRTGTRLQLARLLVAHRLGAEALGVLKAVEQADASAADEPAVLALAGVSQLMTGRPEAARNLLGHEKLQASPDAALWRAAAAAQLQNWSEVETNFARGASAIHAYPADVQAIFRLAALRAAIERSDVGRAGEELALLEAMTLKDDAEHERLLLAGRLAELSGRGEPASEAYRTLIAANAGAPTAEARLRLALLGHRSGSLDRPQAIRELESLALGWRGDEIEAATLRRLAGLQTEAGAYRLAFDALDAALMSRPLSPETRALQDEMQAAFSRLFLDGEAEAIPAVQALALFYDYPHLVPVGRAGDEMIRRMSDRMIGVDLLGQAATLLEHQTFERLRGAARSQAAAKLALVYLMDRKAPDALRVLARTRQAALPADIHRQRVLIEARALAASGRAELALEMLESFDGDGEAGEVAVEALWSTGQWQKAAERIERNLGERHLDPAALTAAERHDVLRAAVAYSQAGDALGLDRLRGKFTRKLADSADAQAFDAVTSPAERGGAAVTALAKALSSVDTLEAYLAAYRARYFPPKPAPPAKTAAAPNAERS